MLKPIFIAHRGYASAFPENTLVALDEARLAGAQYIEVDIQLTSDHIPVLFHDRDLRRLCQQTGTIHNYSFSELEEFFVTDAEKFADKYADNKITSLSLLIKYLKEYPALNAFIELKRLMIDTFGEKKVLETLLPLFEGMENRISFISYNQTILQTIDNETDFSVGVVIDQWDEYKQKKSFIPEWLFCSAEGLPEDNNEIEKIEAKIAVFEVGNIGLAKHLLAKGIKYLETFRIKEMLDAFSEENKK